MAPCLSPAMRAIESIITDLVATEIPVLLVGETGTGKEVVALRIHQLSRRHGGPFIKLRCSGLKPEDFNQPPMSGDEAGAADRSTLFLDEIYDLSSASQARLLEAFVGVNGDPERFQLAAGVISSTCQNLEGAMQNGRFRDDLYYRLSGVSLRLPPLRERVEDILPLANFFLDKYSRAFGRPRPHLSAATIRWIHGYSWPGNVRELENTMKRIIALGEEGLALNGAGETRTIVFEPSGDSGGYSLSRRLGLRRERPKKN